MKQQQLPQVPPEWNWREQAEEFFGCVCWGMHPDDWTCDGCGRIDSNLGSSKMYDMEGQYCAWCDLPATNSAARKDNNDLDARQLPPQRRRPLGAAAEAARAARGGRAVLRDD